MRSAILLSRFHRIQVVQAFRASSSTSDKKPTKKGEQKASSGQRHKVDLSNLRSLVSTMKRSGDDAFFKNNQRLGHTELFNYATNEKFDRDKLQQQRLSIWDKLTERALKDSILQQPANGFEELILLTEQGRLWEYPIDNEQSLGTEKEVPFEDHVFLDQHLEDFSDNEHIRSFMSFVIAGLGRNHWMSVDRKREIIRFFKGYFEHKRDAYKERGFDI